MSKTWCIRRIEVTLLVMVVLFAVTPYQSRAALVEADTEVYGLGSATLDTSTGLEWLDLSYTYGLSFNAVTSMLAEAGTLQGWRWATQTDVSQLFLAAGISGSWSSTKTNTVTSEEGIAGLVYISNYLGYTATQTYMDEDEIYDYPEIKAFINTGLWVSVDFYTIISDTEMNKAYDIRLKSMTLGTKAAFLVREASPVPSPASAWLLGSGLLGLAGISRRKRQCNV